MVADCVGDQVPEGTGYLPWQVVWWDVYRLLLEPLLLRRAMLMIYDR